MKWNYISLKSNLLDLPCSQELCDTLHKIMTNDVENNNMLGFPQTKWYKYQVYNGYLMVMQVGLANYQYHPA